VTNPLNIQADKMFTGLPLHGGLDTIFDESSRIQVLSYPQSRDGKPCWEWLNHPPKEWMNSAQRARHARVRTSVIQFDWN